MWDTGSRRGEELGRVVFQSELFEMARERKQRGERIVFTNGCFDLLHPGHVRCLEQARGLGDALVVAINSDASVRQIKGDRRPITPQEERAEILAALAAVDYVVIFDEPTPQALVARLLPDVLVKGGDWGTQEIVGREEVQAAGGRVVSIALEPGYSTTQILERIRGSSPKPYRHEPG